MVTAVDGGGKGVHGVHCICVWLCASMVWWHCDYQQMKQSAWGEAGDSEDSEDSEGVHNIPGPASETWIRLGFD